MAGGTRLKRHEHAFPHICCVAQGGFVESHRWGPQEVRRGTVRVSSAASHDIEFGRAGARCVIVQLGASRSDLDGVLESDGLPHPTFLSDPWLRGIVEGLDRALTSPRPAADFELDGLVAELLAQINRRRRSRAAKVPPEWLRGVHDRIQDTGGEVAALGEMARELGIHRGHLARAFRDHYGVTIGQCARAARIQRAVRLLRESDLPLSSVAVDAGFADQAHLTRAIRRALQTSPGRIRLARAR